MAPAAYAARSLARPPAARASPRGGARQREHARSSLRSQCRHGGRGSAADVCRRAVPLLGVVVRDLGPHPGPTQAAFHASHPVWVDRQVRHYLIALAYLLDRFTDLWPLGNYKRLALAEKIFGPARIRAAVDRLATVLSGWGYQDAHTGQAFPRVLCEVLLVNRSPRLSDLTPAVLDGLRATAFQDKRTHLFFSFSARWRLWDSWTPLTPRWYGDRSSKGVPAPWLAWAHRWESTSTLTRSTRRHVRFCVLKAGRWLTAEHPTIVEPAAWTRDLCAAYVAAIDRMRLGDLAQRCEPLRDRLGHPLSARSKEGFLGAMRQFFRDCQEWNWIPRRFDPARLGNADGGQSRPQPRKDLLTSPMTP
jgi:hypothetical protein